MCVTTKWCGVTTDGGELTFNQCAQHACALMANEKGERVDGRDIKRSVLVVDDGSACGDESGDADSPATDRTSRDGPRHACI